MTGNAWFVTGARSNGETFEQLGPSAPEWVRDWVREAHDDELPNDWRYGACASIVAAVADGVLEPSEIAESVADVSNADLLSWVGGHLDRAGHVDEWMRDYGWSADDGLYAALRGGQYLALEQMASMFMERVCDEHREYAERCDVRELEAHGFADWVHHGAPALD